MTSIKGAPMAAAALAAAGMALAGATVPSDQPPAPEPSEPQGQAAQPAENAFGIAPDSVYAQMFGMERDPKTLTAHEREKLKYHQLKKRGKQLREQHGNWAGKHGGAVAIASSKVEIIQMAPPRNREAKVSKLDRKVPQGKALRVLRAV